LVHADTVNHLAASTGLFTLTKKYAKEILQVLGLKHSQLHAKAEFEA